MNQNFTKTKKLLTATMLSIFCLGATSVFGQSAPSGRFIVWDDYRNGRINSQGQLDNTVSYASALEAVYRSSESYYQSRAINDQGQTIYEHNNSNPKYWKFQGENFIGSTTDKTDANNWLEYAAKSYVFYGTGDARGKGTVYGAGSHYGKPKNVHRADQGLETTASYVYKKTVSRSDLSKMTATLDLSQTEAITNSGQEFQTNLYIIGTLSWNEWEFIELGFVKSGTGWNGYYSRWIDVGGSPKKVFDAIPNLSISNKDVVNLEWRLENNKFSLYVGNTPYPYPNESVVEWFVRASNPTFTIGTTMCPIYKDNTGKEIPFGLNSITNYSDGTFFGPVKWKDCKLYLQGGTIWNFWLSDSQESMYVNDHTVQVLQPNSSENPTNSEIITISRNGSFSTTRSINISASPSAGGSPSGGGTKTIGTSCTVSANVSSGYTFNKWTENGIDVSYSSSYTFTVTADRNLVANFTQNTVTPPTVTTQAATNITQTTATLNKSVSAGSQTITSQGFEYRVSGASSWSTSTTGNLTGLSANTTYQFRAYATTASGTTYGNTLTFTTLTQTGSCKTIPDSDYSLTPTTSWQTDNWSIQSQGCKIYRFYAAQGEKYSFKTGCGDGATANFDTYLEIFDGNSTRRGYNDDDSNCGNNLSHIDNWECTASTGGSGYYYLKVRGYGSTDYGSYTLAYKKSGMTLEALAVSPSSVNTLSSSFTVTFTGLGNRNNSPISFQGGYALYNSSGTTEIGYSPNSYSYTNLPAYNGWWGDLTQNLTLGNFGLTTMPSQGTYRLYYTYSTNMSSPHTPYIICRKSDGSELYTTITIAAPPTYSITLNKEGGSGGSSSVTVTYGQSMPSATAPTRTGYKFEGYYTGTNGSGTQYYTNTMGSANNWYLTSATPLYARWTAITNTVSFNPNGGSGGQSANVTATYDLAMPSISTTPPTRTGYTFGGWYDTNAASGGTQYYTSTGTSARTWDKTANTTLYARWTATTNTVSFNANGGNGGQSANVTATYGLAMPSISTTPPTRTGYTFGGWYDTNAASGGTQYYTSTGASARTWDKTTNTTLYARWTATQPDLQLLSLAANGTLYQNQTGSFTVTLKNNGNAAYNSHLWVYLEKTVVYTPSQWIDGGIISIAAGATKTITITGTINLPPDLYSCNMIQDINNNPSNMATQQFDGTVLGVQVIVQAASGIDDVVANQLQIFPNPAKEEIFIKSDLQIEKVEIYSLTGALLLSENNFNEKISVSALSRGVYLLKVFTDKGVIINKIVKE